MKAYFHKSFTLERDNISKVMNAVSENPSLDKFGISKKTGIGIGKNASDGKVQPTIQYAVYSGLLTEESAKSKTGMFLNEAGKIVFEYDRSLKSPVTQWVMHYFLCRTENDALIWSYFVHDFLQRFPEFDSSFLVQNLGYEFHQLSKRNILENSRILTSCYTNENALCKVGIIRTFSKGKFVRQYLNYPNPYLAAYILAEIWEAKHADKNVLEMSDLSTYGHFAATLNLKEHAFQDCLEEMKATGAINLKWKEDSLQVVRGWTEKFDLLRRAYSEERE